MSRVPLQLWALPGKPRRLRDAARTYAREAFVEVASQGTALQALAARRLNMTSIPALGTNRMTLFGRERQQARLVAVLDNLSRASGAGAEPQHHAGLGGGSDLAGRAWFLTQAHRPAAPPDRADRCRLPELHTRKTCGLPRRLMVGKRSGFPRATGKSPAMSPSSPAGSATSCPPAAPGTTDRGRLARQGLGMARAQLWTASRTPGRGSRDARFTLVKPTAPQRRRRTLCLGRWLQRPEGVVSRT